MFIHVMNSNSGTDLFNAEIIHRNSELLILAMPINDLPKNEEYFWAMEEKEIVLSDDGETSFPAKAWTHSDTVNGTAIIKFFSTKQDWFV